MNEKIMRQFINQCEWIYAKTYAQICPHEYIVKSRIEKIYWNEFELVIQYIRTHGFEARYKNRLGKYYSLDEHYYWTMGDPIKETIILNRAK